MSEAKPAPRPLEVPAPIGEPRADALRKLVAIVDRLRAPDGCPWDREQTLASTVPHLIEEVHELAEAVEQGDLDHAVEEAGDVLMGLVLLARIAEQDGRFDLATVALAVSEKLERRHPHVFGDVVAADASEALANWDAIKRKEREAKAADTSALAGIPVALPALQRAQRMGSKALSAGFRWDDVQGALAKLREEVDELAREIEAANLLAARDGKPSDAQRERLESELGDVLMAGAFLGNYLRLDPERATRAALRRFESRFRAMERDLARPFSACTLDEMMSAWRRAKAAE
ncbi:MAG: nucleoside triphosphate pyrophosphohydrolase [Planctomycetes bacterium]|nr:nucleoside triphosphate pyrophosphohydrolase [Planctomycetota bacterium]